MELTAKELIKYFKSLGIEVHTTTKARGHQGFFLKNRIDISKNIPEKRIVPTLLHEFAHYVHYNLEPDMPKTGGTFNTLFCEENPIYEKELFLVTNFVDTNSLCKRLFYHRQLIKEELKKYENIIKSDYPKFMRSKKFKEFERYIKKTDARYLLKYDRVKLIKGFFFNSTKIYTIETIEKDFTDMPRAFAAYIRLKSYQRKQSRVSSRINRLNKYYTSPAELFARFVEGIYLDEERVKEIAPASYKMFNYLLETGYYGKDLAHVLLRR